MKVRKKLAALLAVAMCLSVVPQTVYLNAAEPTEPGISVLSCGAHMNTANRLQSQTKTTVGVHSVLVDGEVKTCTIKKVVTVYVTYCTQCGQILHSSGEIVTYSHSIAH